MRSWRKRKSTHRAVSAKQENPDGSEEPSDTNATNSTEEEGKPEEPEEEGEEERSEVAFWLTTFGIIVRLHGANADSGLSARWHRHLGNLTPRHTHTARG